VVEISQNEAYLKHLLHEFDADTQHFNPGFSGDDAARTDLGFRLCRSPIGYRSVTTHSPERSACRSALA
jgi:hypothetical protein